MGDAFQVVRGDVILEARTGEASREVKEFTRQFRQEMAETSTETLKLTAAQQRLETAIARHGPNSRAAIQAEIQLRQATDQASQAARRHESALDRERRSLQQLTRGAVAGSGAVRGLGRQVAFASGTFLGGAGLAAAFTSTLRTAGEFQRALQILRAVTGATESQMSAAANVARELGRDIHLPNTSARDAAEAMTELAKAGFTAQQAMDAARGTLQLAAAAGISVSEAAKISSRQINAFALSADDAGRVADVLAAAANAASGEIPDMALAFSQASNVAKRSGLSIEDTAAALALFANNAILGSDAGTSLRVMLTRFIPVSARADTEMKRLGLSAFTSSGEMKPLRQIMQEYHDVLVRLTPRQRAQALQVIFGQDAQRAANLLLVEGVDAYDKLRGAVDRQGAAAELSRARNAGYLGALDAFKSSVETLQISLGEKLLPTFTDMLRDLTEWVNRVDRSGELTKDFSDFIKDAAATAREFAEGFNRIHSAIDPVVDALGGFDRVIETIFLIKFVRFIGRAASSFGLLTASSSVARTKIIADAAAIEAALDTATRPRVVSITTTTTGTPGTGTSGRGTPPGTPVPTPRRGGGLLGGIGGAAAGLAVAFGATAILDDVLAGRRDNEIQRAIYDLARIDPEAAQRRASQYGYDLTLAQLREIARQPYRYGLVAQPGKLAEIVKSIRETPAGQGERLKIFRENEELLREGLTREQLNALAPLLFPGAIGFGSSGQPVMGAPLGRGGRPLTAPGTSSTSSAAAAGAAGRTDQDFNLALARATTDRERLALLGRRRGYLASTITRLERLEKTDREEFAQAGGKDRLIRLYAERERIEADIEQIHTAADRASEERKSDRERRENEADRRLREGISTREQRLQNVVDSATAAGKFAQARTALRALAAEYRRLEQDERLTDKERAEYASKRIEAEKDIGELERTAVRTKIEEREKGLDARLEEASGTPRFSDDRRVLQQQIQLYRRLQNDERLTQEERSEFRKKRAAKETELAELEGTAFRAKVDIMERNRRNATLAAELTEGTLEDDRAALKREILLYRTLAGDARLSKSEQQEYEKKKLEAQKALKALKEKEAAGAADVVKIAIENFRLYGTNIGPLLSPQDARGLASAELLLAMRDQTSALTSQLGQQTTHLERQTQHLAALARFGASGHAPSASFLSGFAATTFGVD